MFTQSYELYYIVPPAMTEDQIDKLVEKNENLVKGVGAINLKTSREGVRHLSYPIKHQNSGFYIMTTFEVEELNMSKMTTLEKFLNYNLDILRYIIVNQTEYIKQKEKEILNPSPEYTDQRQLNAGRSGNKKCIFSYLGRRVVDYKETAFLKQFMSPYAKILSRNRTGLSAKAQRKVTTAIKRARHMALLPFVAE